MHVGQRRFSAMMHVNGNPRSNDFKISKALTSANLNCALYCLNSSLSYPQSCTKSAYLYPLYLLLDFCNIVLLHAREGDGIILILMFMLKLLIF